MNFFDKPNEEVSYNMFTFQEEEKIPKKSQGYDAGNIYAKQYEKE